MADPVLKPANLDNKTVRRILAAALELWTREGYHGASLKEIADAAGVAKSLLHYHFASKEHLLSELQAVYFRKVSAEVRERIARRKPSIEGALEVMDEVFEIVIESAKQFPFALEIWRAAQQSPAVRGREVFSSIRALYERPTSRRDLSTLEAPRMADFSWCKAYTTPRKTA